AQLPALHQAGELIEGFDVRPYEQHAKAPASRPVDESQQGGNQQRAYRPSDHQVAATKIEKPQGGTGREAGDGVEYEVELLAGLQEVVGAVIEHFGGAQRSHGS